MRHFPAAKTISFFRFLSLAVLVSTAVEAGESRWYVQGTVGQAGLDGSFGPRFQKVFDDEEVSATLGVGYSLNPYLAVEAGYHDLGSHAGFGSPCPVGVDVCIERLVDLGLCVAGSADCVDTLVLIPVEADLTGWSLSAVPSWRFSDRFSVYGRVGIIDWESDVSSNFPSIPNATIDTFSDQELLTGIGFRYGFPSGLGLLLEYEQFDLDVVSTHVGVHWRF